MKKYVLLCSLLFSGCTYSVNMVHTTGEASDVIDETQENTPDISPEISVPLTSPMPGV